MKEEIWKQKYELKSKYNEKYKHCDLHRVRVQKFASLYSKIEPTKIIDVINESSIDGQLAKAGRPFLQFKAE